MKQIHKRFTTEQVKALLGLNLIPTSGPSYRIKDKLEKVKKVEDSPVERGLK